MTARLVGSDRKGGESAGGKQLPCDPCIQRYGFGKLLFLDILSIGMRDMNRSRPDEERLTPIRQCRNIGGERGHHSRQSVDLAKTHEGDLEIEVDLREIPDRGDNASA